VKKSLTCISCPIGCAMTAEFQPDGSVSVTGNQCSRGAQYARDELVDPRRVVTATCRTTSQAHPRLSVRSREPCPKDLIPSILQEIYRLNVSPPVRLGDVLGSFNGIQIVATRSMEDETAQRHPKAFR
jgi:CxxC motif-containing protein